MVYQYLGKDIIGEYEDIEILKSMFHCQFRKHYPVFVKSGIITKVETDNYKWNCSKSSLAQYFMLIAGREHQNMEWGVIELTFKIKRGTLRRLASTNGNMYKQDDPGWKAKDFEKILKIIEQISTV